jgi:transposase
MDVHRDTISVAALPPGAERTTEARTLVHDVPRLVKWLRRLERRFGRIRTCYEASGAGYVLYRELASRGIPCEVVAPSLIPKRPGDRKKTDRRDAEHLAIQYRAGGLTMVCVPDREDEAIRALIRCRKALTKDILRARHQVLKHLRRNGQVFRGTRNNWTQKHWEWLERVELEHRAEKVVLRTYLEKLRYLMAQRDEVDEEIRVVAFSDAFLERADRLMCFKGFDVFGSMAMVSEVGDFWRFATAQGFMDYVGLVPTEHSSGDTVRRGGITKTGNSHCRHVLIQASWAIVQTQPRVVNRLRAQWEGRPPWLVALASRAMKRLHGRFWYLVNRGKPRQVAIVAVARELAGFVWAAMQDPAGSHRVSRVA